MEAWKEPFHCFQRVVRNTEPKHQGSWDNDKAHPYLQREGHGVDSTCTADKKIAGKESLNFPVRLRFPKVVVRVSYFSFWFFGPAQ